MVEIIGPRDTQNSSLKEVLCFSLSQKLMPNTTLLHMIYHGRTLLDAKLLQVLSNLWFSEPADIAISSRSCGSCLHQKRADSVLLWYVNGVR